MFETAELGHKRTKDEYTAAVPGLRTDLLRCQYELRQAGFPVLLALSGDDRPGTAEALNVLNEWMDPRFLEVNTFGVPTDEETERPLYFRYWRALPARGRIGVFLRGWTMQTVVMRLIDVFDDNEFERRLNHARNFERSLVADGALIVKIWLHLPEAELKARVKAAKKNPDKYWRMAKHDIRLFKDYDRARTLMERAVRLTSTAECPWRVVESTDDRYRNLAVGEHLRDALQARLARPERTPTSAPPAESSFGSDDPTVLDKVDLTQKLPKPEYSERKSAVQARLFQLTRQAAETGVSTILVFEGWDAAGKGGIVRRLTQAVDPAMFRVIPIAAPTEEELAHHYLWRFWRHLPRQGRMTIYDRSWYGRVLVERVEGFARPDEWSRAYAEINDFEEQLCEHDIVLLKFWLHIDRDEQLRRFEAREQTPFKKFKITEEDYRNREKWNDYERAANEMIERTSTEFARWHLVAANDKRHARVFVLETVAQALEEALKRNKR